MRRITISTRISFYDAIPPMTDEEIVLFSTDPDVEDLPVTLSPEEDEIPDDLAVPAGMDDEDDPPVDEVMYIHRPDGK